MKRTSFYYAAAYNIVSVVNYNRLPVGDGSLRLIEYDPDRIL